MVKTIQDPRRILQAGNHRALGAWVAALAWNAISWPVAVQVLVLEPVRDPWAYAVALFPLVGLLLAGHAVRATLQRLKFGRSAFYLHTHPVHAGQTLRGVVETNFQAPPAGEFTLVCTAVDRAYRGSGKNRRLGERPLWQERWTVPGHHLTRGARGLGLSVALDLPADVPPSHAREGREGIFWLLHVTSAVPGVDYEATFEVPVLAPAPGARVQPAASPSAIDERFTFLDNANRPGEPAPMEGVTIEKTPDGSLLVHVPAFRAKKVSFVLGVVLAAFGGASFFLHGQPGAPWVMALVFDAFTLLLALFWANVSGLSSRVAVNRNGVAVARSLFGLPFGTRSYSPAAIRSFQVRQTMTASSGNGPPRVWYAIKMGVQGRKFDVTLADLFEDKKGAEALARKMDQTVHQR